MKVNIFKISAICLLWAVITAGCNKSVKEEDDDEPTEKECNTDNPLTDLLWLKEIVDAFEENAGATGRNPHARIYQCAYSDGIGFLLEMCVECPDAGYSFRNCEGAILCEGDNNCSSLEIDVENKKLIWEMEREEFCSFVNTDDIDQTIPIVDEFLAGLPDDLNDTQKLEALAAWLKSQPCIVDATIVCDFCIGFEPPISEIMVSFDENGTTKYYILDISMTNPLKSIHYYKYDQPSEDYPIDEYSVWKFDNFGAIIELTFYPSKNKVYRKSTPVELNSTFLIRGNWLGNYCIIDDRFYFTTPDKIEYNFWHITFLSKNEMVLKYEGVVFGVKIMTYHFIRQT